MVRILLAGGAALCGVAIYAAEPEYNGDVAQWLEVAAPPAADQGERMVWHYAACYSKHEWRVDADGDRVDARLTTEKVEKPRPRPSFDPTAEKFRMADEFADVGDGWLVGFNAGEFGAALYWFSHDGKRNYKVSDDQVVAFFTLDDGVYAIEGLAHGSESRGSVIRMARPDPRGRWQAHEVTKLPFAPYAVSVCKDGTMLIALSDALVAVGDDRKVRVLLADAPWDSLYPNSSVLSRDEQKLYIGMRQFVGELDLKSKTLRLVVPTDKFLNKLPDDQAKQIRKTWGGQ
jgi:hypothetical protein